jgi:WD40 repeat protein
METSTIQSIVFSSDGTRLTSVSADGTLRTWNADAGQVVDTSQLAGAPIYAAEFSPDGTRLAYGGESGTLEIIATLTLTPGAEPGRMSRIDTVQGLSNNSPRTTSGPSIRDAPNLPRRWLALPGQVRRYVRRGWRIPPERVC